LITNLHSTGRAAIAVTLLLPLALLSSKLYEAYLENFFIVQTVRLMMTDPQIDTRSSLQIKQDLAARLHLQGIKALSADQIDVMRNQGITYLQIHYSHPVVLCGSKIFELHYSETFP
jgi:hypothetical protein